MKKLLLGALALASFWSSPARGEDNLDALKRARPRAEVRVSEDGRLLALRDPAAKAYAGTPTEAARAFLADLGDLAPRGLGAPVVRTVAGREIVYFPVQFGGFPVLGRGASVSLAPGRRPTLAWFAPLASESVLATAPASARLKPSEAQELARRAVGHSLDASLHARLVWVTAGAELLLAYEVRSFENFDNWVIQVDAASGEILSQESLRREARALVFEQNPGQNKDIAPIEVELPPVLRAEDPGGLVGEFALVTSCDPTDGFFGVCDNGVTPNPSGDFLFRPALDPAQGVFFDDDFALSNALFHVDRIHSFFQALGATDEEGQLSFEDGTCCTDLDSPLPTRVNLHNDDGRPVNNAFFEGTGISFGAGTARDFSYDADVIYHEYTHAVISFRLDGVGLDALGFYSDPGALNEGTADIFAALFFDEPEIGEYAGNDPRGFRSLRNDRRYPRDLTGEVHDDGEIWGGAFWDIKDRVEAELSLPRAEAHNLLARVYIATLFSLPSTASLLGDAAQVAIDVANDLGADAGLDTVLGDLFREVFISRGILKENGTSALRVISLNQPANGNGSSCSFFVSNRDYCQFTAGVNRNSSLSVFEFRPGKMQYKVELAPGATFSALFSVKDVRRNPSDFQIFIRDEAPVEFTQVKSENQDSFRFTFQSNADRGRRPEVGQPLRLELNNPLSETQTFFLAFGIGKGESTSVIARIEQLDFHQNFTGGTCSSAPGRPASWAPLALLLLGLSFTRRRARS